MSVNSFPRLPIPPRPLSLSLFLLSPLLPLPRANARSDFTAFVAARIKLTANGNSRLISITSYVNVAHSHTHGYVNNELSSAIFVLRASTGEGDDAAASRKDA